MKTLIAFTLICALFSFKAEDLVYTSDFTEEGIASYYSDYYQGRLTANGEIFEQRKLTAAHKSLPFGTEVNVLNLSNNKTVQVIINDRGPFIDGRIIDLSYLAAEELEMIEHGIVDVKIEAILVE